MIETTRLLLRPMKSDDVDDLLRIFKDPKVMAAFERGPFGRDEMTRWVERNLAHQRRHGYGLFTVIHKAEGLVIGDCGLEHRAIQGRAEIELGCDFCSAIGDAAWRPRRPSRCVNTRSTISRSNAW